jgi:hypothetical protein
MNKKIEEVMANAVADGRVVETPPQGAPQDNGEDQVPSSKAETKLRKVLEK